LRIRKRERERKEDLKVRTVARSDKGGTIKKIVLFVEKEGVLKLE